MRLILHIFKPNRKNLSFPIFGSRSNLPNFRVGLLSWAVFCNYKIFIAIYVLSNFSGIYPPRYPFSWESHGMAIFMDKRLSGTLLKKFVNILFWEQ